jgi:hypothetical protein
MDPEETELDAKLKERFEQLPKVVQDAITSADVEKRMRALAETNKLHLDQWESLENEVQLTLMGVQPIEDLQKNIKSEVGVSDEVAASLTADISKIVFEPIREELERQLEHPEAKAESLTNVEAAGRQEIAKAADTAPAAAAAPVVQTPAVMPATPGADTPTEKSVRAPISETYKPGEASSERKTVHDDPYREPPA